MKTKHTLRRLAGILLAALVLWAAAIGWLARFAAQAQQQTPAAIRQADTALVLGNAVHVNGHPNPCMRSRVAAAAALYHAGKVRRLVVSGGDDADGSNQGQNMRAVALSLGVPADKIAVESRSETTFDNLRLSAPLLQNDSRIVLVSSGYHLPRALWLAERQWPSGKQLQVFAGDACDAQPLVYMRKLVRESLAWVKAVALYAWRQIG